MNADIPIHNQKKLLLAELCPDEIWQLSETIRSVIKRQISRLPKREVSEWGTRYPEDMAGMRAFLQVFFTRHLFQIQSTLVDHVSSPDFLATLKAGRLRMLDIGSGPAVASLAITDMVTRFLVNAADRRARPRPRKITITHVLNDPAAICLATGKHMLTRYGAGLRHSPISASGQTVLTMRTNFPENLDKLRRLAIAFGGFDIVLLSYVVKVLSEAGRFAEMVRGIQELEQLCSPHGRIVIVQDKFQKDLLRRLAQRLGVSCHKQTVTQEVYPQRGENKQQTYTYYDCLYAPSSTSSAQVA